MARRRATQLVRRLRLDNEFLINDEIKALHAELDAFVHHAHGDVASNTMTSSDELSLERHYVYVFEEAEAKPIVDFIERANYRVRESFFDQFAECHGSTYDAFDLLPHPSIASRVNRIHVLAGRASQTKLSSRMLLKLRIKIKTTTAIP